MSRRTGRLWRTLTALAFLVMTAVGLAWHTGWGTLSSFGLGSIAQICPLGAFEAMLRPHVSPTGLLWALCCCLYCGHFWPHLLWSPVSRAAYQASDGC